MDHIIFNGKIVPADTLLIGADSRALKFGDGIFETMHHRSGKINHWEKHMERFFHGLDVLKFRPAKHISADLLWEQVKALIAKNKHENARVRLSAFRKGGGLFDPVSHEPAYLVQTWSLQDDFGALNQNGLQLGIYQDGIKSCDLLSNIKHNNYLLPAMAAFFAKENKLNDALILNQHGRICETSNANIFFIKDGSIITPALSEGCVAGTMRAFLLDILPGMGYQAKEDAITIADVQDAEEIFITNALRPIRWIAQVESKKYSNNFILQLLNKLQTNYPAYFKL